MDERFANTARSILLADQGGQGRAAAMVHEAAASTTSATRPRLNQNENDSMDFFSYFPVTGDTDVCDFAGNDVPAPLELPPPPE